MSNTRKLWWLWLFSLAILRIEQRASHMLSKSSTLFTFLFKPSFPIFPPSGIHYGPHSALGSHTPFIKRTPESLFILTLTLLKSKGALCSAWVILQPFGGWIHKECGAIHHRRNAVLSFSPCRAKSHMMSVSWMVMCPCTPSLRYTSNCYRCWFLTEAIVIAENQMVVFWTYHEIYMYNIVILCQELS